MVMSHALTQVRSRSKNGSMAEMVARKIAEMSGDGDELVEFAFRVWRDPTMPFEDRRWAFEWIAKYGAGLPTSKVEVSGHVSSTTVRVNLEHYTFEEMDHLEQIRRKAEERANIANAKVIDVLPAPDPT